MAGAPPTDDPQIRDVLAASEAARARLVGGAVRADDFCSTYVAHTPDYTIVDTRELLDALGSRRVSYDNARSSVEYAASHGAGIVVLMGAETVVPSPGQANAGKEVVRRFTDIYRREGGAWRRDVRQASYADPELARAVVPPSDPRPRVEDSPAVKAVLDYRKRTLDELSTGARTDPTSNYSPAFVANTPMNTIIDGAAMAELFASGRARYSSVTQTIGYARAHTPEMVVVMGAEIVVPGPGLQNAGRNIHRRFTDVFLRQGGAWRHDVRHAVVVRIA